MVIISDPKISKKNFFTSLLFLVIKFKFNNKNKSSSLDQLQHKVCSKAFRKLGNSLTTRATTIVPAVTATTTTTATYAAAATAATAAKLKKIKKPI